MKKTAVVVLLTLLLVVVGVFARPPDGPRGNSDINSLFLYEKVPSGSWPIVEGGAWGRLMFSDSFVFNGHGLEPNTDYTLIRYLDPWPGSPVCLAAGTSNNGGEIHLSGDLLPGGRKVWLVLTSDVDCDSQIMAGWDPTRYLFENNLI